MKYEAVAARWIDDCIDRGDACYGYIRGMAGVAMITAVRIDASLCECNRCHHRWYSIAKKDPEACPNRKCRSREWNGVKARPERPQAIALPKPATMAIKRQTAAFSDEEF